MNGFKVTVGLEIHAELKTQTKMFCNSKNDPEEKRPNVNICPVCMAHPGTLPVINKEAVKHVLKVGKALEGELADFTEFDRKNYFYPDIPKGYQISQYENPLVKGGKLAGVEITRVHLEEDTARSSHDQGDYSLVDFNRAGVPLMELVTEPVIHDAETAGKFARELQLLLRYLGASDANMEKGEMRVEANISVSKTDELGTKVEVKNLNSFKSVEQAIAYETKRHIEAVEKGEKIVQETRGWDENRGKTFSQRAKESAHDYRYFPDPDLPKLKISEIADFQNLELPELPAQRRERLISLGLKEDVAGMFTQNKSYGDFFEEALGDKKDKNTASILGNYISSDLAGLAGGTDNFGKASAKGVSSIVGMIQENKISSRGAKDTLKYIYEIGGDPKKIAEEKGLLQKSDEGELKKIVEEIISNNESVVEEYKGGKEAALQFLVGQGMKATKGSANPGLLAKLLKETIG